MAQNHNAYILRRSLRVNTADPEGRFLRLNRKTIHVNTEILARIILRVKITQKKGISRTTEKCPECGGTNLIHDYDTGETICG